MFSRCAIALGLACSLTWGASAQSVSRLYSRQQLEADSARYGEQVSAEYRDTLLPNLTPEEKAVIASVKIEFPATGPKGDPFEFYTDGNVIYLPALSLRFFSDLCVASAWLNAHGFDGTTVRDYVGLLFREASLSPSAPLPPVFKALGVPPTAREENAVAQRASRNFGNTVVFLLAHELGHILKKHRTGLRDPAQQRMQEVEADAFAIELMRRIGQLPLGLEMWFDLERIRHAAPREFPQEADWQKYLANLRHPVTNERLEALAKTIEKAPDSFARLQENRALWTSRAKMFAQMFRLSAPFSGNAVVRVAEYSRVRDLRLASLKPRKAGFAAPTGSGSDEDFQGLFRTARKVGDAGPAEEFELLLLRSGEEVTGSYANATLQGSIEGRVVDGIVHFSWKEDNAQGRGRMESAGDTLRGTWGRGEMENGAGTWGGLRSRK